MTGSPNGTSWGKTRLALTAPNVLQMSQQYGSTWPWGNAVCLTQTGLLSFCLLHQCGIRYCSQEIFSLFCKIQCAGYAWRCNVPNVELPTQGRTTWCCTCRLPTPQCGTRHRRWHGICWRFYCHCIHACAIQISTRSLWPMYARSTARLPCLPPALPWKCFYRGQLIEAIWTAWCNTVPLMPPVPHCLKQSMQGKWGWSWVTLACRLSCENIVSSVVEPFILHCSEIISFRSMPQTWKRLQIFCRFCMMNTPMQPTQIINVPNAIRFLICHCLVNHHLQNSMPGRHWF